MDAGQIELYTHHPLLPRFVSHLQRIGVRCCVTYLLESQFMEDKYKFFSYVLSLFPPHLLIISSGVMSAMSAMVNFEVAWINVLTKMDLVNPKSTEEGGPRNGARLKRDVQRYLEPDPFLLDGPGNVENSNPKFHALSKAVVQLVRNVPCHLSCRANRIQIEDHPLVAFIPLDLTSSDSIEYLLSSIDFTMQYGEDEEPKEVRLIARQRRPTMLTCTQPADLDEGDFGDMME